MSGCVFGNVLTDAQQRKLLAVFRKRSLVLLLDPEEFDSSSTSRVVPAIGVTMAASRAARALNSDDLPALVSPIRTMR